jgi:hypothetical protein
MALPPRYIVRIAPIAETQIDAALPWWPALLRRHNLRAGESVAAGHGLYMSHMGVNTIHRLDDADGAARHCSSPTTATAAPSSRSTRCAGALSRTSWNGRRSFTRTRSRSAIRTDRLYGWTSQSEIWSAMDALASAPSARSD